MAIASINPATGESLKVFGPLSPAALQHKLDLAWSTFHRYRGTSFAERTAWLNNAARILEEGKQEFGRIMTAEMGKTWKSAIAEAEKCASACRYYAENGARHLAGHRCLFRRHPHRRGLVRAAAGFPPFPHRPRGAGAEFLDERYPERPALLRAKWRKTLNQARQGQGLTARKQL